MPANRIYYGLKPYLPWHLRIALRRVIARWQRKVYQDVWPIKESAGQRPSGWPGWPKGKKFAFVLTHDVEGPEGLVKSRQLMQLERELGFRSSFNFIPAGGYTVSGELREELVENGFEVGVHDLRHDGRLFRTRRDFSENAKWINHYLKTWGAKGFRSGFMLRNLDWLHELDIQYDASTFDTDPFEPEPEGIGTIFPFWVPRPDLGIVSNSNGHPSNSGGGSGYVQLPYTLPQDSTLFVLLREPTPEIWLRKLDWIAKHGGMALVNVHSDYLRFPGEPPSPRTFPVAHYVELLEYVRKRYAGAYWQALPREVAEFGQATRPLKPKAPDRRVGMIVYSAYERDNRVIRYAQTLAARGDAVEVICLKKAPSDPAAEKVDAVQVYRTGGRYKKDQKKRGEYLLPLLWFSAFATMRLAWRHLRHPYDLVHVHNMPDFLVFAALFPKLTGAKVILDIHDIMPEFYGSKFQKHDRALGIKVLKTVEGASARFANHVIISNHLWLKPFSSRSAPEQKCSVFINYVNQGIFYRRPFSGNGGKRIIMFPGGLQWHQGLDIAIRAMPQILKRIPMAEFHIYGDGNRKGELVELARTLELTQTVRFFDPLPVSRIAEMMARADLGIVPKRADSFGNEAYSTKILEFMSLGVPMVVSNTKIDQFYFNDSIVRFFESGNSDALAEAVIDVLENNELRRSLITNALKYADLNCWSRREGDYTELVDSLIENRPVTSNKNDVLPDARNNVKNGHAHVLQLK
jgi:glycosyltransferase involved in cell wall biosynthesis